MRDYLSVFGKWRARTEDCEAVARRLVRFLANLSEIDPLFTQWQRGGSRNRSKVPLRVTLPPILAEVRDWLEENPLTETRNQRKFQLGYWIAAHTQGGERPSASFHLRANIADLPDWLSSEMGVVVLPGPGGLPDCYRFARQILTLLVEVWDVDWAGVASGDYRTAIHETGKRMPEYKAGWMVYLGREQAQVIAVPEDIGMEKLENGAILMTATEAEFDRRNREHFAAAQRIQKALAPLNGDA